MPRSLQKNVLVCSRRTDVLAFYYDWLQKSLEQKKASLVNQYTGRLYTVDLSIENTHSIVLWSKNFSNYIKNPGYLSYYNLLFMFSISGLGLKFEPRVLDTKDALEQIAVLSKIENPDNIVWRYEPLFFLEKDMALIKKQIETFKEMASFMGSIGIKNCIFGPSHKHILPQNKTIQATLNNNRNYSIFIEDFINVAGLNGISATWCGLNKEIKSDNIKDSIGCINQVLLESRFGGKTTRAADSSSRDWCKCIKTKDIGGYWMKCYHGCIYCINEKKQRVALCP